MTVRGSSTPARFQGAAQADRCETPSWHFAGSPSAERSSARLAKGLLRFPVVVASCEDRSLTAFGSRLLALVALGILTGGGCIASGPLAGGASLSELASSKTKRPVVTAAYGESGSAVEANESVSASGDVALREKPTPIGISAPDAEGTGSLAVAAAPADDAFADDRFAKALAQLPAAEAAALRQMLATIREGQMLATIREGAPSRSASDPRSPGRPAPSEPSTTERVPYIVEERADFVGIDTPPSARRDPARTASDSGEYFPSEPVAAAVATVPVSPFVAGSLAAFTSTPAYTGDASPLAHAFEASTSIPSVRPTSPVAQGAAPPTGVAQAGAISEIVNSGDSASDVSHGAAGSAAASVGSVALDSSIPAPDWHSKLAEATRALSVAIDRPGASETERKALEAKLRLLQAIEHRFAESLVPIDGSPEEQAFWKELCGALQELFDPQATPYDDKRATLALRRLDEATRHLSKSADLDVARLAFCTAVERFGQYDEFKEYAFSADQEALLYVEVRRFAAETVEQPYPGYRTALEGSYRIVEVGGGKRWAEHIFPVAEEVSRSPRSDFFIAYRVYLPKNLPAGKYRLEFNLHDQVGDKHGSGWLDFAVKSGR